jgi:hypothetical protein
MDPLHVGPDAALLAFVNGRYPHANDLTQGDGLNTGGFRFNSPTHLSENNYITRGGQIVNFKDPASGQMLVAAFAALSQQVRTAVPDPNTGLITVSPQPFFENQVFPGATGAIANSSLQGLVTRGDLKDTVQALNAFGLLAPGIGLSPQFDTNVYVTNQSFSAYNGLLATLRKKLA